MKRIMIFNDQYDTLDMYLMILERQGYHPFPRLEATATETDVETVAPDLVILDWTYGMEQRGIDAVFLLRSFSRLAHTPMIVCSGSHDSLMFPFQATLREQHVDVLRKPFEVPELLMLIDAHLAP